MAGKAGDHHIGWLQNVKSQAAADTDGTTCIRADEFGAPVSPKLKGRGPLTPTAGE